MSQLLKGVALFIAVTCGVWLAVLWRWDATHHPMAVDDILVYLGLLPLVVFGFVLALRWAWRSSAARQAAQEAERLAASAAPASAAAARTGSSAASPAALAGGEAERHTAVQLLAACTVSLCGDATAALLAAARDGEPRPDIDAELRDEDGLPVLCARIPGLAPVELDAALASTRAIDPSFAQLDVAEHVQRALAALAEPLRQSLQALLPWAARFEADPECRLRVLLAWPVGWSAFDEAVGQAWAERSLAEHAPAFAGPARRLVSGSRSGGVALWRQVDQLLLTLAREQRAEPVLVAACHSDIGAEAVAALERDGRLFVAGRRPKGAMAGEAAAALLLADDGWPPDPDAAAPPPRLHRAAFAERDKDVDAAGRVSSDTLLAVVQGALTAARIDGDAVAALVSDADRHTARGTELFGATLKALPQLDAVEDLALLGAQLGATGAAGLLLAVAGAAAAAAERDAPCLALSLAEPRQRCALAAKPASLKSAALDTPAP